MSSHLPWFAERVAGHPQFLGTALAAYAHSEQLADEALARVLECSTETLTRLRLCGMPRSDAPFFAQDLADIASTVGVPAEVLAPVVRRGQTLLRLQAATAGQVKPASLLAARTRPPKKRRQKRGES